MIVSFCFDISNFPMLLGPIYSGNIVDIFKILSRLVLSYTAPVQKHLCRTEKV